VDNHVDDVESNNLVTNFVHAGRTACIHWLRGESVQRKILWFSARLCVFSAILIVLLGVREKVLSAAAETVADGLTVVVDAGHGGFDGGAVGVAGTVEAGLNLAVAKKLEAAFTARGVRVLMTREDENALAETKQADMHRRGELLRDARADAVVSVHMNTFGDAAVHGTMTYYMQGSTEGQKLAECVVDAVTAATGQKKRAANPGDYFVVRECTVPAVLVECGFLSNPEEEQKLKDDAYQTLLAEAIADGVGTYFLMRGQ